MHNCHHPVKLSTGSELVSEFNTCHPELVSGSRWYIQRF